MKKILVFVVALTLLFQINLNAQTVKLDSGLVAYYPFNGDANDASGNGNNATNYGSSLSTDRFGNANSAYHFNGTSNYMNTFTSFDYQYSTISIWIDPEQISDTFQSYLEDVVLNMDASSLSYGTISVMLTDYKMRAIIGGGGKNFVSDTLSINNWYHLVMVRNNDSTSYYLNGQYKFKGYSGNLGSATNPNPNMVFGTDRKMDRRFYQGKLDDIRIYNRALNMNEVDSLFNEGGNFDTCNLNNGLVAYYPFNGNANDASGNGNNATNYGSSLSTDRFGNANSAYHFNGTSNYMNTFTSFDYQYSTISIWIDPEQISDTFQSYLEDVVLNMDASSLNYGTISVMLTDYKMRAIIGGGGKNFVSDTLSINNWYHLVMVRNNDSTSYYLNGQYKFKGYSGNLGSATNPNPNMVFGTDRKMDRRFYQGKIDDIRIYNRALKQCEITSLYQQSPDPCLTTDCVWPGDANNNGVANVWDILPIGIAYNQTGAVRPSASLSWTGQPNADWSGSFLNGTNYKHADCIGDGEVTINDLGPIFLNYGAIHNKTSQVNGGPGDPELFIELDVDVLGGGSLVTALINFGTNSTQAQNVYGMAFSIGYNPLLVDTASLTFGTTNSWLGNPGNSISIYKNLPASGQVDIGITRIDQMNASGYGTIGALSFFTTDNLNGKTAAKYLNLSIQNAQIIANDESNVAVNVNVDSVLLIGSGIQDYTDLSPFANIYPIPVNEQLNIKINTLDVQKIEMFNMLGELILTDYSKSKNIIINTKSINNGLYLIKINTLQGNIDKKLIIKH